MNWDGPILTDSGGYQIFSLAKLRKITEEGVRFQNHLDGTPAFISPEIAMEIQAALGSDIAMVLDECPPWPCEHDYAARSLEMTTRWAKRCKDGDAVMPSEVNVPRSSPQFATRNPQLVFGIVQGATFEDLRRSDCRGDCSNRFRRIRGRRSERGRAGSGDDAGGGMERAVPAEGQAALRHGTRARRRNCSR